MRHCDSKSDHDENEEKTSNVCISLPNYEVLLYARQEQSLSQTEVPFLITNKIPCRRVSVLLCITDDVKMW